ncbi:hypothetical protein G3I24_29055 [Micromonospora aurantiaca]|nr:hypothetical protein [Micromonospora aurantiaca]
MGNGLGDSKLDGWNDPAEEAATFPPKVIPVSDLYDYQTWAKETRGWRKLEAAVNGGAALTTESGQDHAKTLVSVRSVVETAQAFQATQDLLIWLEQTIRTAVTSMVGDDKAWKGPAANGFRDKMNYYADLLGKQAEHLAGGAVPDSTTAANSINSSTNRNSLPSQLYDAANHLAWAQQTITYLDRAWASIASDNGVGSGSGPVPISGTEYEKPMAQQMSEVVHTVAEKYRMTTDKAATSTVSMPTPSITTPTMPDLTTPDLTTPKLTPPPTVPPPVFTTPSIGGVTTPPVNAPPNITVPTITPPNLAGGPGTGGPGTGQGPGTFTPPSFSGPGEIGGPTPGGGGAGSGLPGFDAPGINGPGGLPGGGLPGSGVPGGFVPGVVPPGIKPPGSANLGGGAGGAGSVKPPSFSGPGEVGGPKPGAGTGAGIGRPGGGFTAPGVPGFGSPGGAGPGAGGSPSLPEKPDANGLLGNSDDFVPGAVDGVDIPAAPGGAVPGGGGFQSPMMPGMPGAGAPGAGAGGGSGVPEAPDAKGLVEGDEADWRSPGFDGVQAPGAPAGAHTHDGATVTQGGGDGATGLSITSAGYTLVPSTELVAGRAGELRFQIRDDQRRAVTRFAVVHDKPMHVIMVRRDLSGYRHLHPTMAADGTWSVPITVPEAGPWRMYADFTAVADDGRQVAVVLGADLTASGAYRPRPLPAAATSATVDGFTVGYAGTPEVGKSVPLRFQVTGADGAAAVLEPYLGAYGHLVALREGDLGYLHVHPEPVRDGDDVTFWLTAPGPGSYRMFLDFQVGGVVRTAEFTLTVA